MAFLGSGEEAKLCPKERFQYKVWFYGSNNYIMFKNTKFQTKFQFSSSTVELCTSVIYLAVPKCFMLKSGIFLKSFDLT